MKKTTLIGVALMLIVVSSCSRPQPPVLRIPSGWREIRAGSSFSLYAPAGTTFRPGKGVDSFVGGFDGANFRITFDYGAYSNTLQTYAADPRYQVEHFGVGSQLALFVVGPSEGQYGCGNDKTVADMYVLHRMEGRLEISACMDSVKQTAMIRSMFRTIRFLN